MSLIKCPECGHEVSDLAASCPQCGCPIGQPSRQPSAPAPQPKQPAPKRAVGTIAILSLVILALGGAGAWYLFFRGGNDADERARYDKIIRFQNEEMLDSMGAALNEYFDTYTSDAYHYSQLKALNDRFFTERADWQAANGIKSLDAIRHFLDVHPDGLYLKQANRQYDSLSFVAAVQAETREAYEHYLSQFPQGAYTEKARQKMAELDKVELSIDEKMSVTETLTAHFDALASNDKTALTATLASKINSYIGKADPELEDIYAYMQNMHSSSRIIVFMVKNEEVSKVDVAGRSMYNVQFVLEEDTYAHSHHSGLDTETGEAGDDTQTPEPTSTKRFKGAAVLDGNMRITSLVLRQ